jgi:hypothetical protein
MSSSDIVWLIILPGIVWVSLIFVLLSDSKFALKLRSAWNAKTKRELVEGSRSWAIYEFVTFSAVFAGLLLWARVQESAALTATLNPGHWVHGILDGIILGLAMLGVALIFRKHFPEAQKFSLLVMAGVASSPPMRVCTLLLVVFTEELWRAVCLKTLAGSGIAGPQALIATSIAYGLTFLAWGTTAVISECIVGATLGGFFLWTNSFFVSFAAHLTLLGQVLLYAVAAAPDAEPGDFHRRPFTKCPACGTMLSLRQVNLNPNEAFSCPFCATRVTVSDWRRGLFRWGYVFISGGLWVASLDILPGAVRNNTTQYFLSWVLMFCSSIGFWSILQVAFPPKLECGDPDFVGLNLGDKKAVRHKEESGSEDGKSNSK